MRDGKADALGGTRNQKLAASARNPDKSTCIKTFVVAFAPQGSRPRMQLQQAFRTGGMGFSGQFAPNIARAVPLKSVRAWSALNVGESMPIRAK